MTETNSGTVELILGPYRSGKTTLLIEQLLAFKKTDQLANVLVLVPSARYGRILKERIGLKLRQIGNGDTAAASKHPGIFGLEIQPFYQCCLKVVSKTSDVPRIIPEEIRPALMTHLLAEMKAQEELTTLSNIAEFHGTGASVLELIDELQRAGLAPEEVISRLEASSCQESHLLELARVYDRYWQRLKELDFFDQKSLALKAREQLFSATQDEFDLIIIDGFDRVSHLQAQVFAGLAQRSRLTKIAFDYVLPEDSTLNSPTESDRQSALKQSAEDYRWKDGSYDELLKNLQPKVLQRFTGFQPASTGSKANSIDSVTVLPSVLPSVLPPVLPAMLPKTDASESVGATRCVARSATDQICTRLEALSLLDPFLEMVEVTRQIKSAMRNRHILPSELIVVTRSPDAYNGAIEAAFEDSGIPYFIDGSSKVSELEPWRFIHNLLTLAENKFRRKNLIDLLRSPFMNLEALAMKPSEVSSLDRQSYEARLVGSVGSWRSFLSKEDFSAFSLQLLSLLASLEEDAAPAAAKDHARRIEDLLDKYMKFPGSDANLRGALAGTEREAIKALRRCLKMLIMQEDLLLQGSESFAQFWQRLNSLIEKTSYARPRPQTPAVTICSAELVPNMLFREIYLCGVTEGDFPKHQISTGFLSPDQIRLWLSFGIDIRNPRQEPGFERALFYSLTERASERLLLSLPQFNGKAEETLVSFYIEELSEKTGLSCRRVAPFAQSKVQPVSVREALSCALWHDGVRGAEQLAQASDLLESRWQEMEPSLAALLARSEGRPENLFNGYLVDFFESRALGLPEQNVWTASKINDYGKCPFRYWATHLLALKPREEAEEGLNFALIGQFYHKVLEFFFSARAESQKAAGEDNPGVAVDHPEIPGDRSEIPSDRSEIPGDRSEISGDRSEIPGEHPGSAGVPPASGIVDAAFTRGLVWIEARSDFQPGPYWPQEKKDLRFRITRFIERELLRIDDGEHRPQLFEVNFGGSSPTSFPPLLLQTEDGNIVVRGSIDRVDMALDGSDARIIDYKSSSRSISPREAERGRNLQLPIYALALEQCINPKSFVSEADYLSISAARPVGHMDFRAEKHANLKTQARQFVQDYAASVNRGVFTVKPNGRDVCKDCKQATVCRVAELKSQWTEETDASTD